MGEAWVPPAAGSLDEVYTDGTEAAYAEPHAFRLTWSRAFRDGAAQKVAVPRYRFCGHTSGSCFQLYITQTRFPSGSELNMIERINLRRDVSCAQQNIPNAHQEKEI